MRQRAIHFTRLNRKMDNLVDSDLAMIANNNFEDILSTIRNSCLNYSIQVSPFSATISLRKTIIKDRAGAHIISRHCEDKSSDLRRENSALEEELRNLRSRYEELLSLYSTTNENITLFQKLIKDRDSVIIDLIASNTEGRQVAESLRMELSQKATRYQEEKCRILTEHHQEANVWNQDLSHILTNHRKLEEKYRKLSDKYEPTLQHVESPKEFMPHQNSTSSQDDLSTISGASIIGNATTCCAPSLLCGSEGACARFKGLRENLVEEEPFSSSVANRTVWNDLPISSLSCTASLRSHFVPLIDPEDIPFRKEDIFGECDVCGQSFNSRLSLQLHNEEYPLCCRECGVCFRTSHQVKQHDLETDHAE